MSSAGVRVGVGTRFRFDGETVEVIEMAITAAGNEAVLKDHAQCLVVDGSSETVQSLPGVRAGQRLGDRVWKVGRLVGGAQERVVARAAARAQRYPGKRAQRATRKQA